MLTRTAPYNVAVRRDLVLVLLVAAAAFGIRTYPAADAVFSAEGVRFLETDAWYHVRLIEHQVRNFPARVTLDPFAAPGGQFVPIAPLFDTLTSTVVVLLHGRGAASVAIERVAAVMPPVFGALTVVAVWALARRHDRTAGVALALSTMKPQMAYLIVPFLLMWAWRERRTRFLSAFFGALVALLALSFLLQPSWVGDWLRELNRYTSYTAVGSPAWVIMAYFGGLGTAGEWLLALVLYVGLLWAWWQVIARRRQERWLWTVMLTLTLTHVVAPRTATTHFVAFAAPLLFVAAHLRRRGRAPWALALLGACFLLPWLHFLTTVSGEFEHPATYVPLPLATLALLVVTRRLWWDAAAGWRGEDDTSPTAGSGVGSARGAGE